MINANLAQCAQINFENLERAVPQLKTHPYYMVAKAQLDEALGGKSVEEALQPHIKTFEISIGQCSSIAHCFVGDSERCACGKTERSAK